MNLSKLHLKTCLPLYLSPIYITGLGGFGVGVGLYSLLLPVLAIIYFNDHKSKKIVYYSLLFIAYIICISYGDFKILKVINFSFGSFVLIHYFNFCVDNYVLVKKQFKKGFATIIIISIFLYLLDLVIPNLGNFAFADKDVLGLSIPRISGVFLEPSHFGLVCAAYILLHSENKVSKLKKIKLYTPFIISQSFFAYIIIVISKINIKIIIVLGLAFITYLNSFFSIDFFFKNSGLVRLFGLFYIINDLSILPLIGNGIGYGQLFFGQIGESLLGLSEFNGFLADLLLDIGVLGMILLGYIITFGKKNKSFIILIFIILNSNFGLAVSLFPVLLSAFYISTLKEVT